MPKTELTEVELTLREVRLRDRITDEERTGWQVENEELDRPVRGDSPQEALELFAACLETDNDDARIELEDLETGQQPLA
ncbi:hypothetical protein [Halorubrum sp. C191]|uniref:hypothetical protein n=1 Tax=Halorubrum sp. C191 TaxID=1383842 RepID=UPI0011818871|nr:hypothetical protein [Halorubrum sp. C191]